MLFPRARAGKRVLPVDPDAQANLTMSLGFKTPDEIPITIATMFKAHIAGRMDEIPTDYVLSANGVDFLPAVNALAAADEVIVPMQAQYLSAKGLDFLLQTMPKVQANLNPALRIAGIVITMPDGRAVFQKSPVQEITEVYGTAIHLFEQFVNFEKCT